MGVSLSVVIPTYNGEKFITAALESIRRHGHESPELIVVDDGSSDGTLDIVREFARTLPIQLITPGRVGNWVAVSNLGLREARGDWACFLHQDDFWLPGRIARLQAEMAETKGSLIIHNAMFAGPEGQNLGPWTCPLPEGDVPQDEFKERLLIQNFIAMPSPVFRRSEVLDTGGLDESLWFSADWDLWLRLGTLGPVRFVNQTLAAFRLHAASQTIARKTRPGEWEQQLTTVLTRHLDGWAVEEKRKQTVEKAAMASIVINSALSAASRGEALRLTSVLTQLLGLGPSGSFRYFRDSRIVQRVASRLKLRASMGRTN